MTKFLVVLAMASQWGIISERAQAELEPLNLFQSTQALLADQRLVGNVSAQAKREGVIIDAPELFVYYADFSPAYHLSGYRKTLIKELDLTIQRHRLERSMVDLDRLLERAETPQGDTIQQDQLPNADLYAVIYRQNACSACDQVQSALNDWLSETDLTLSLIVINLDQP